MASAWKSATAWRPESFKLKNKIYSEEKSRQKKSGGGFPPPALLTTALDAIKLCSKLSDMLQSRCYQKVMAALVVIP
jgi:hypothetical protein